MHFVNFGVVSLKIVGIQVLGGMDFQSHFRDLKSRSGESDLCVIITER